MSGLRWSEPRNAPVVIVEGSEKEVRLLAPIYGKHKIERLLVAPHPNPVTIKILLRTFFNFFRTGNLSLSYGEAVLWRINPKIAVTFIDNSIFFQKLAALCPDIRFLAIQNGARYYPRDLPGKKPVRHSEFACFGLWDKDQTLAHEGSALRFYPVGSLREAYYREKNPQAPIKKKFDLCYISQIKPQHYEVYPKTVECLERIALFLRLFAEKHDCTLCVAARRHPGTNAENWNWEVDWFKKHLGDGAVIIPNEPGEQTSYRVADESIVSLAMHSTTVREAMGRGNRILSCNFTGDPQLNFPVEGPWSLTDADCTFEQFEARLLAILKMTDSDWAATAGDTPRYLIGYSAQKPTDIFLRELVNGAVSGAALPKGA